MEQDDLELKRMVNRMSVLFLQSPYSFLFRDIGQSLHEKEIETFFWAFNYGDKYLYKGLRTFDVHENIKKYLKYSPAKVYDYDKLNNVKNYYTEKVKKREKRDLTSYEKNYFVAYMNILESFIKSNGISCIVCQNDTRWQHDLAKRVADKLGVKIFVFELGLFRPSTITIDPCGVNFNNSVPRDTAFYEKYSYINKKEKINLDLPQSKFKRDLVVAKYIIYNSIGKLFNKNSIENKDLKLGDYISRFYKSYFMKEKEDNLSLPKKYIFVPFQVNDDSQILVHSNFNHMLDFIEVVISSVEKYNLKYQDNLSIIFKEHPMDIGKINYQTVYNLYSHRDDLIFLKSGNVNSLIANSEAVVTINSTVGLEAIEQYKPVICLGNAFYCIPNIANFARSDNLEDVLYRSIINNPNKTLIDNFLNYLKYNYQFPGDEYFYNKEVVENIVRLFMNTND